MYAIQCMWQLIETKRCWYTIVNAGQWGWRKWHNKSYTGNMHDNNLNVEYNQGVDLMK